MPTGHPGLDDNGRVNLDPTILLGAWAFQRTVDDRLAGQRIAVDGVARFTASGPTTLDWHERGTMHLPSGDVPVTQHRVLTREGAGWTVDFADGRGFHPWAVGVELLHDCAPDRYRGRVDPAPLGSWTLRWEATGPAKDYIIDTVYRRSAAV